MLDPSGDKDSKLELDECKEKITANLQQDIDWREMTEEDRARMVGPPELTAMRDALAEVGNPRKTLRMIYETMGYLIEQLEEMLGMLGSGDEMGMDGEEGLKGDSDDDLALRYASRRTRILHAHVTAVPSHVCFLLQWRQVVQGRNSSGANRTLAFHLQEAL
jgi:hypothetical protein